MRYLPFKSSRLLHLCCIQVGMPGVETQSEPFQAESKAFH